MPFGMEAMHTFLPHLFLILAHIPVLFLYRESPLRRMLMFIGNVIFESITETLVMLLFHALTSTGNLLFDSVDYAGTELASARILIIDCFMLGGILLIHIFRRSIELVKNLLLVTIFVCCHLLYLAFYLHYINEAVTDMGVLLQLASQTMFYTLLIIQYYSSRKQQKLQKDATELKLLRLQMESSEQYYKLAESRFTEISKLRHDIHAQIGTASALLQMPDGKENAERIIEAIRERLDNTKTPNFCENRILNAVLSVKLGDVRYSAIQTEILLEGCGHLPFDDYDLCSLVSNLFDNAAESCLRMPDPAQTVITLKSGIRSGCFLIRCVNPFSSAKPKEKAEKRERGHGYGQAIIRSICQKYDGEYTLKYEGGNAIATVLLQIDRHERNAL